MAGYVSNKVGSLKEQKVPKGFKRQAQDARINIDEFRSQRKMLADKQRHANKPIKPFTANEKHGMAYERLRIKAAKKGVKLSPEKASNLITKSEKAGKIATNFSRRLNRRVGKVGKISKLAGKFGRTLGKFSMAGLIFQAVDEASKMKRKEKIKKKFRENKPFTL